MINYTLLFSLLCTGAAIAAALAGASGYAEGLIGLAYGCGLAAYSHYMRTEEPALPKDPP